ncbi:MAG TPA: SDR family oxidoreductase [Thermoleophilaceae bacterium]
MSGRTILVTGGTGLIGQAVVDALGDTPVISLTRHGAGGWREDGPRDRRSVSALLPDRHGHVVRASEGGSAVHVSGDVVQPRLGLSDDDYADLAERVDAVVHAAGVSDFTTPRRVTEAMNVESTRNVARFAERAGAPLYHISTGYVRNEGTSVRGRWGAQVYLESKRAAEAIARECGTYRAIIRPSVVFGHSRDGSTPSFQGLHRLVGMMLENRMPLLPFSADTLVDFLPRDVIGGVTARLVLAEFEGEFWLTAGEDALSFGRVVELLLGFGRDLGRELQPPRFVSMDMIDRLIKPAGGEAVARRVDLLLALTSHHVEEPLPSSLEEADRVDLEQVLLKGARYWAERQGLSASEATAEDAVPA